MSEPDTFFRRGVLLDGELAWDCGAEGVRMVYHAFDGMNVEGTSITRLPLVDRLQVLMRALDLTEQNTSSLARYAETNDTSHLSFIPEEGKIVATAQNNYNLLLQAKSMMAPEAWARQSGDETIWQANGFAADGLVFTPRNLPVYVNTHRSMLKWKPAAATTIDLECVKNVPRLTRGGKPEVAHVLCGLPLRLTEKVDDGVYECSLHSVDDIVLAHPERRRNDKTAANSRSTAEATLRILDENITLAEVRAWCGQ